MRERERGRDLDAQRQVAVPSALVIVVALIEPDFGSRVQSVGRGISSSGFRIRVWGAGCMVSNRLLIEVIRMMPSSACGLGLGIKGLGFMAHGLWFKV